MNREDEMISVILPVRDGDIFLLRLALDSVRKQSFQNYEILLVDDGSENGFAEQLDCLADENPRIRLFHQGPGGVSAARNFALDQALGGIVTFLDADDLISPICFEEASSLLRDPEVDACWGGTQYFTDAERDRVMTHEESGALSPEALEGLSVLLTQDRFHQSVAEMIGEPLRFDGGYFNRGIAARFLRRELFEGGKHRFPPGMRLYEDTLWNLKLLRDARVLQVRRIWYYYYENPASASNRFQPGLQAEMETSFRKIKKSLDLNDAAEYTAYTRFLMDSLRYVVLCCFGHPAWRPTPCERRAALHALYKEEPWCEIGSRRYRSSASPRDRRKAELYRLRMLFLWWKIQSGKNRRLLNGAKTPYSIPAERRKT